MIHMTYWILSGTQIGKNLRSDARRQKMGSTRLQTNSGGKDALFVDDHISGSVKWSTFSAILSPLLEPNVRGSFWRFLGMKCGILVSKVHCCGIWYLQFVTLTRYSSIPARSHHWKACRSSWLLALTLSMSTHIFILRDIFRYVNNASSPSRDSLGVPKISF